jgi:hypothetical protein
LRRRHHDRQPFCTGRTQVLSAESHHLSSSGHCYPRPAGADLNLHPLQKSRSRLFLHPTLSCYRLLHILNLLNILSLRSWFCSFSRLIDRFHSFLDFIDSKQILAPFALQSLAIQDENNTPLPCSLTALVFGCHTKCHCVVRMC